MNIVDGTHKGVLGVAVVSILVQLERPVLESCFAGRRHAPDGPESIPRGEQAPDYQTDLCYNPLGAATAQRQGRTRGEKPQGLAAALDERRKGRRR